MHALRSSSSSSSSATGAAAVSPHLLTSAITQCETLDEALQVFGETSASFNNVHVAAMVSRLPKVGLRAPFVSGPFICGLLDDSTVLGRCLGRRLGRRTCGCNGVSIAQGGSINVETECGFMNVSMNAECPWYPGHQPVLCFMFKGGSVNP
jgi:hypothetical protein